MLKIKYNHGTLKAADGIAKNFDRQHDSKK